MTGENAMKVVTNEGATGAMMNNFAVRFVPSGEKYGRRMTLTCEEDLLEFYDPELEGAPEPEFITRIRMGGVVDNLGAMDLMERVGRWKVTEAGLKNAMKAIAPAVCAVVAERIAAAVSPDALCDIAADLVHDIADENGIPEGQERDAFRLAEIQGFEADGPSLARIMTRAGVDPATAYMMEEVETTLTSPAPKDDADDMGM